MFKIAVLVSGSGTNMTKIIENNIKLDVVISDRECKAIEIASQHKIDTYILKRSSQISDEILTILNDRDIDLVVLAGFLSILKGDILREYKNKIINIHPSLLPKYGGKGMYGLNVHKAVLNSGDKITGCTVHYVNDGIDKGDIIKQEIVNIEELKTEEEIQKKVLLKEWKLLPEVIKEIIKEREN